MQASCAARHGAGVLLVGPPGSGKSDLLLRLLDLSFMLVADDRVEIEGGCARPPAALAGLLEVRGLGIVRLPYIAPVRLSLVCQLGRWPERLPAPSRHVELDLPLLAVDALQLSAPQRIALALRCVLGQVPQLAGAFGP